MTRNPRESYIFLMTKTAEHEPAGLQDGEKIQRLREEAGFSRPEFAEKLGITHGALINIEKRKRPASLAMLLRIARELAAARGEQIGVDELLKEAA